ncbi:polyhydroxyalkanoic acid system family protein [Pseudomonas sp. GD04087]|uniref:polyhydroxyalkanoic acid system family protein n=1 Tax=Pseudomonas TaxID=286 RepID=UPI001F2B1F84|nr:MULTISPECIES: polyhydroxyalkanoic acid system family protein [Pseudomonas]MCP1652051.1 putative polyhydroxyalkanoate system protein [Pseudomonas nitroreducens]MCP1689070.1 putative polyhydroxyalkanoate system protein [Pseudomonas nitroreducens]MDH0291595.1 polyhydroxyalkanoic acid system family protein [Pseudomonas sp. GD04087]MDH1051979.1 polyhydroxyalkanoic acid system family protein [Pseudomonas sp. GD03903]MDH2001528.1 polyhydroxyalkanoic acid system family protein [Pseudomonas sp. GD03
MSRIHVERNHSLGLEAARAKAEKLADKLSREHGVSSEWQGDTLLFKRSGVDGRIEVGADKVAVDVKLGLMLSAMGGLLKGEIERALDKALA